MTTTSTQPQVPSPSDLVAKYGNKSRAIRALTEQGKKRTEIASMLDIRYQFVRNVQITPIKRTEQK